MADRTIYLDNAAATRMDERVLEAFRAAEAQGQGVITLDGQMVDAPVVARARQILAAIGE